MRNYVRPGLKIPQIAPSGGTVSGQGVLIGTHLFGIAGETKIQGESFTLVTDGEFDIAKTAAQTVAIGAQMYWNNTSKVVTTVATGNKPVGIATGAAASNASTVRVKLVPNLLPNGT